MPNNKTSTSTSRNSSASVTTMDCADGGGPSTRSKSSASSKESRSYKENESTVSLGTADTQAYSVATLDPDAEKFESGDDVPIVRNLQSAADNMEQRLLEAIDGLKTTMVKEFSNIRKELDGLTSSQQFIAAQYEDIKSDNDQIKKELTETKRENLALRRTLTEVTSKLQQTRSDLDTLEQYTRRDCLVINGVPSMDNENTDDIVIKIGSQMGLNVVPSDISVSHRVPSSKDVHPIVVKFTKRTTRDLFY